MRCGKHALNNACGGEIHFTNEDLETACDTILAESMYPDDNGMYNPERREDHVAPDGWYSEQVLAKALQRTLRYRLGHMPLHTNVNLLTEDGVVGALVNQGNAHWVALKRVDNRIWLLDSLIPPRVLSYTEYVSFAQHWRSSFPVFRL